MQGLLLGASQDGRVFWGSSYMPCCRMLVRPCGGQQRCQGGARQIKQGHQACCRVGSHFGGMATSTQSELEQSLLGLETTALHYWLTVARSDQPF